MKLYLDDVRDIPEGWVGCRTALDAMATIAVGDITHISFDHDLGEGLTGYDVAIFIEKLVHDGVMPLPIWAVHSSNPVGRKRIEQAMKSAERFNDKNNNT